MANQTTERQQRMNKTPTRNNRWEFVHATQSRIKQPAVDQATTTWDKQQQYLGTARTTHHLQHLHHSPQQARN
jgi:hypothetical protein